MIAPGRTRSTRIYSRFRDPVHSHQSGNEQWIMRPQLAWVPILTGFLAALGLLNGSPTKAEISPLPDPEIEHYLGAIQKPYRLLRIPRPVHVEGLPDRQRIEVYGSISDSDITILLKLSGYHRQTVYRVVGDGRYARLMASPAEGTTQSADLVFARQSKGWLYLYLRERIS